MEELRDVVLNVYTLQTDSPDLGRTGYFVSRLLPSLGMGAFHTSLTVGGSTTYTFGANVGIVQTPRPLDTTGLPPHAQFRESIALGSCHVSSRGQINAIVKKLSELYFHNRAYHLVHRNCNHFTETFATALICRDELLEEGVKGCRRLATYPDWINRLATTSGLLVAHDDDIVPCQVLEEAAVAVGANENHCTWNLKSSSSSSSPSRSASARQSSSAKSAAASTKKELTAKQKAVLAKLRSGGKT